MNSQLISNIQTLLTLAQCIVLPNFFFEFVNSTSTAKQASLSLCQLSVNWLYVAFCNRIFDFSSVLCLLWNGVEVVRLLCSSGYRLCSIVKCVVSSVLGNSSL